MTSLNFKRNDIKDKESYLARAKAEAQLCYNTPSTRRGREWDELFHSYKQGHTAEYYLIENFGFKCAGEKYEDLINPDGVKVEVKTRTSVDALKNLVRTLNKEKISFKKIPDILYFWLVEYEDENDTNPAYYFHAKYEWKKYEDQPFYGFVQTSTKNL